jgi:predicted Holliday junction resolvase-like endonuclease
MIGCRASSRPDNRQVPEGNNSGTSCCWYITFFYFHSLLHTYIPRTTNPFFRIIMPLTDLLIPAIAFILGIIVAYLFFRQQISAIEGRARNDLERWKLECTNDIRKDSVSRSRSTLKGRISEQMAPLLPEFPFAPADARFIGNPIDFVVFDGYTQVKDEKGDIISVVLVEVKKGKGRLTREETLIKRAVEEGRVSWRTIFLKDEEQKEGSG